MEVDSEDEITLNVHEDWTSDSEGAVCARRARESDERARDATKKNTARDADAFSARPATPERASGDENGTNALMTYCLPLPNGLGTLDVAQVGKSELGTVVWNAALALCETLRSGATAGRHALGRDVQGRDVLEIGAGCGTCGFYASALGAREVTIADCGPATMANLERTLAAYRVVAPERAGAVKLRRHLWEEDHEILVARSLGEAPRRVRHWSNIEGVGSCPTIDPEATFDVVVGSDLLYFASQEDSLLAALRLRLRLDGTCIIVQTLRNNNAEVFARFIAGARTHFAVQVESVSLPSGFPTAKETPHALLNDPYRLIILHRL